ncbi:MAG: hypothetical protein JNK66_05215 [Chitinophagales bacterium]|nr:hypothetical protein [Chitinophagales bacterium]
MALNKSGWLAFSVLWCLGYILFGFHFEDYEGNTNGWYNGSLLGYMDYPQWVFNVNIILFRCYLWLGSHFHGVGWSSLAMAAFATISGGWLCHEVWVTFRNKNFSATNTLLLVTGVVMVYILPNIFILNILRNPLFTGVNSLLILLLRHLRGKPFASAGTIGIALLWIFAVLTRIETTIFAPLAVGGWVLINGYAKQVWYTFVPFVTFGFLLIGFMAYDYTTSPHLWKRLEPTTEDDIGSRNNLIDPRTLASPQDSIKWIALRNHIFADTPTLTYSFIKGVIKGNPLPTESRAFRFLINNALNQIEQQAKPYQPWLWWLIMVVVLTKLATPRQPAIWLRLIATLFFFALLLIAIGYGAKIHERIFSFILMLTAALVLLGNSLQLGASRLGKLLWLITYMATLVSIPYLAKKRQQFTTNEALNIKVIAELEKIGDNKVLALDPMAAIYMNVPPFRPVEIKSPRKLLFFDSGVSIMIEVNSAYFAKQCNCDPLSLLSILQFFEKEKKDWIWVTSRERIALYRSYMKIIYGYEFDMQRIPGTYIIQNVQAPWGELGYYTMK